MTRVGEAVARGVGDATGSIFGNTASGFTLAVVNVFKQGISQLALMAVSQDVNLAIDAVIRKLGVSETVTDGLMQAPSYASSLMTPPAIAQARPASSFASPPNRLPMPPLKIVRGALFLVSLSSVLALGAIRTVHAQASLDQVPTDMRAFVVFGAGVKNLSYFEGQGMRFLRYDHEEKAGITSCGDRNGHSVHVGIDDFVTPTLAHDQFDVSRMQREMSERLTKISAQVSGADEAAVFEVKRGSKCFLSVTETVLRVGSWQIYLEESWWYVNTTPPPSGLAARLAALARGEQPLTPAEVAFRNTLMGGLGLASKDARSCLDEVMNVAEGESGKDQKMAGDIARLHDAASRVHAIQVLAAVPVGPQNFDDFDSKWWDALKEVVPDPTSTPDPQETTTDRLIDLLPPPMNTVVNIVRTGSKTMRAIKTHIVDPAAHGEIYACYRRQRQLESSERITEKMGQDALESAAAQVLLDATGASCKYAYNFKTSYEPQLKGFTSLEARHDEFKRLLRPVALRFEFIYQVEDAKARQQTLIAERWKPVQDILDRLRTRVNACIADRASKAR